MVTYLCINSIDFTYSTGEVFSYRSAYLSCVSGEIVTVGDSVVVVWYVVHRTTRTFHRTSVLHWTTTFYIWPVIAKLHMFLSHYLCQVNRFFILPPGQSLVLRKIGLVEVWSRVRGPVMRLENTKAHKGVSQYYRHYTCLFIWTLFEVSRVEICLFRDRAFEIFTFSGQFAVCHVKFCPVRGWSCHVWESAL